MTSVTQHRQDGGAMWTVTILMIAVLCFPIRGVTAFWLGSRSSIPPFTVLNGSSMTGYGSTNVLSRSIPSMIDFDENDSLERTTINNALGAAAGMMRMDHSLTTTTTTRRGFLSVGSLCASSCCFVGGLMGLPQTCVAKYGASSTMELPNYIEFLMEKNAQGMPTAGALYQGADRVVLLKRLQDATNRLQEIPPLADSKKWSQIQGLLTGPLGTLSQTLNQIVTSTTASSDTNSNNEDKKKNKNSNGSNVQLVVKKIKADLIEIGQAASKKDAEACRTIAGIASQDLVGFLELAFEE